MITREDLMILVGALAHRVAHLEAEAAGRAPVTQVTLSEVDLTAVDPYEVIVTHVTSGHTVDGNPVSIHWPGADHEPPIRAQVVTPEELPRA